MRCSRYRLMYCFVITGVCLIPAMELVKTNTVICEEGHIISDICWNVNYINV